MAQSPPWCGCDGDLHVAPRSRRGEWGAMSHAGRAIAARGGGARAAPHKDLDVHSFEAALRPRILRASASAAAVDSKGCEKRSAVHAEAARDLPLTTPPRLPSSALAWRGCAWESGSKKAGISSFTIFEKSDRLGGTWYDNSYPGAGCDVPSHLYCFSFEPNPSWSRKFSLQPEIQDYLDHCAVKYGLMKHIRFRTEIASASFDEGQGVWRMRTTTGEELLRARAGERDGPAQPAACAEASRPRFLRGYDVPLGALESRSRSCRRERGCGRKRSERNSVHSLHRSGGPQGDDLPTLCQLRRAALRSCVQAVGKVDLPKRSPRPQALSRDDLLATRSALLWLLPRKLGRQETAGRCTRVPVSVGVRSGSRGKTDTRLPDRLQADSDFR